MDKKVTAMFTHLLYGRYYCALSWTVCNTASTLLSNSVLHTCVCICTCIYHFDMFDKITQHSYELAFLENP